MSERPEEKGQVEPDWEEQLRCRPGFDWLAECGVFMCLECGKAWYPMELDEDACPECDHDDHCSVIHVPHDICQGMHTHQHKDEQA